MYLILITLFLTLSNCAEETISGEDPLSLKSREFTFIPKLPKTNFRCEHGLLRVQL
jgi:hypothetical protein